MEVFKLTCHDAAKRCPGSPLNNDDAERSILFWNNDGAEVFKLMRYSESPGTAQKCSRLIYNDAEVFKLTWKEAERSRLSWNDVEVSRLAPERRRLTLQRRAQRNESFSPLRHER
jgi:hypothetical protein